MTVFSPKIRKWRKNYCLRENEKASKPAWLLAFRWRRRWDSNPRAREGKRISSAPRYDRFDTSPNVFQSAFLFIPKSFKKLLERKTGEKAKKHSIFSLENPVKSRVSSEQDRQAGIKFRVSLVMTTSIPLRIYQNCL